MTRHRQIWLSTSCAQIVKNKLFMKNLLLGMGLSLLAHIMIWFQANLQFFNVWAKNNMIAIALMFAVPISLCVIKSTSFLVAHFDGMFWPGRLLGFGMGSLVFATLIYTIMGEGINMKSFISILLSLVIVLIQIFWK